MRLSFSTTVGVDAPARKVEQAVGGWNVLDCVLGLQHPFNVNRDIRSNTSIHPLGLEANALVGKLYALPVSYSPFRNETHFVSLSFR